MTEEIIYVMHTKSTKKTRQKWTRSGVVPPYLNSSLSVVLNHSLRPPLPSLTQKIVLISDRLLDLPPSLTPCFYSSSAHTYRRLMEPRSCTPSTQASPISCRSSPPPATSCPSLPTSQPPLKTPKSLPTASTEPQPRSIVSTQQQESGQVSD